jgi:hypothetical protein
MAGLLLGWKVAGIAPFVAVACIPCKLGGPLVVLGQQVTDKGAVPSAECLHTCQLAAGGNKLKLNLAHTPGQFPDAPRCSCFLCPQVLAEREELYPQLRTALEGVASVCGQRVLVTPGNPISLALTLDQEPLTGASKSELSMIGSMLWAR